MSTPKVETAVAARRDHVFIAHNEVAKLRIGNNVGAMFAAGDFIDQHAVLRAPTLETVRISKFPTVKVHPVKERFKTLLFLLLTDTITGVLRFRIPLNQA